MKELAKYETAKRAVADCASVDEVMAIRNDWQKIECYARLAKDFELQDRAIEIRMRAERRLGELMATMPKAKGGGDMRPEHRVIKKPDAPLDLKSQGIDKNLAHRARTSKTMSDNDFEVAIRRQQQSRRTQIRKPKTAKPGVTYDVDDWAWLIAEIGEEHAVHLMICQLIGWFRRRAEAHNMSAVELLDKLLVDPQIDPTSFSLTVQQKIDAWKRRLEAEFEERVLVECRRQIERYQAVLDARKGVMPRSVFNKIRQCLHPDWVVVRERKKLYDEAFAEFNKLEVVLIDEKECATRPPPLPGYDEIIKMMKKHKAARTER
jgi:hypothetical protein